MLAVFQNLINQYIFLSEYVAIDIFECIVFISFFLIYIFISDYFEQQEKQEKEKDEERKDKK